jgi:hypothetical protein
MEMSSKARQALFERCGFSLLSSAESLSGKFSSIFIYSIHGLRSPSAPVISSCKTEGSLQIILGIGADYNQLVRSMIGDDIDESDCMPEGESDKSSFIVVLIRSTEQRYAKAGYYLKQEDRILFEYEMFRDALVEIENGSVYLLSSILQSLVKELPMNNEYHITKLKTFYYGKTDEGILLQRLLEPRWLIESVSAESDENLRKLLELSISSLNQGEQESTYFFSCGLSETDFVKRFLFFYISIEKKIDEAFDQLKRLPVSENFFSSSLDPEQKKILWSALTNTGRNDITSKFILCAREIFNHITPKDVKTFRRLHRVRIGLAHGRSREVPTPEDSREAYHLARRLLTMTQAF